MKAFIVLVCLFTVGVAFATMFEKEIEDNGMALRNADLPLGPEEGDQNIREARHYWGRRRGYYGYGRKTRDFYRYWG